MNGRPEESPEISICASPAATAMSAGAAPLYGTCVMLMPAIILNSSPARWPVPASPEEPKLIVPGFALASAISSFTEAAGSAGCTISASGLSPMSATGSEVLRDAVTRA